MKHLALEQAVSPPSGEQTASSSASAVPLDPSAPGAHFERQLRAKPNAVALDVFAVLGLPADDPGLTQRGARRHYRLQVARHVYERGETKSPTTDPLVPLWSHVNVAKGKLLDEVTAAEFEYLRELWGVLSVPTWNPFAEPGSAEALSTRAPGPRTLTSFSPPTDCCCCSMLTWGVMHAVPPAYYVPDIVPAPAPNPAAESSVQGSAADPLVMVYGGESDPYDDDDDDGDDDNGDHDDDDGDDEDEETDGSIYGGEDEDDGDDDGEPEPPPKSTSGASNGKSRRPAAKVQRLPPSGICVGTWKKSPIDAIAMSLGMGNAVYCSEDKKGHMHRRIAKVNCHGVKVNVEGRADNRVTTCRHDDILYLQRYEKMSKTQVDRVVRAQLAHRRARAAAAAAAADADADNGTAAMDIGTTALGADQVGLQPGLRVVIGYAEGGEVVPGI